MSKLHFVGIGGIGMSGLAALCRDNGDEVTGSDRGAERPENQRIIGALRRQGVKVFPQDGSFVKAGKPDYLVYSTAIEEDNPDFAAAKDVPRLHRSQLLAQILQAERGRTVAVTGSCGKSSVTAYLAEALVNLGADPRCLNGALSKRFATGNFAGNYRPGRGGFLVFEADESDKSLLNYGADYAVILNLGTDHYDKAELARVFGEFLGCVRKGAVLERGVYEAVRTVLPPALPVAVFDAAPRDDSKYALAGYQVVSRNGRRVPVAHFSGMPELELPQLGRHTALNALAICALLQLLGYAGDDALNALKRFDGVWRRSDFAGTTASGALVYDDYAHNPEKILSCLEGMREAGGGRVLAVFQPHGYGPFGFMNEQLFTYLEAALRPGDRFWLLEPFYAGGTSSFKPTAKEVMTRWQSRSAHPERFELGGSREELKKRLLSESGPGDVIVIMGARDNSLSDYAASLAAKA